MSVFPGPISQQNTSAAIAGMIREAILRGQLKPGERLKEDLLAKELEVSRTPVREALVILQTEGLIESSRNRGSAVKVYSPGDLDELYELRGVLEGYAAFRAATRVSAEQLDVLRKSCTRLAKLKRDDLARHVEENGVFHLTVLEAAQSARLTGVLAQMRTVPLQYQSYAWYDDKQLQLSVDFHRKVLNALAAGDAERAEKDMREHLNNARSVLTAAYAKAEGEPGKDA